VLGEWGIARLDETRRIRPSLICIFLEKLNEKFGGCREREREERRRPIIDIIIAVLDALARDTHYKYLALFSVPVCAYFVIANWVGWQFFRNS